MVFSWGFRRKVLYASTILVAAFLFVSFVWFQFFSAAPTCFDTRQNGDELGVDCSGSCALICASQAKNPVVLWARVFQNGPKSYTAAAYIQNNNGETAAKDVPYLFQLYDADNKLVTEKSGTMDIPPVQTIPIIESNITVDTRVVSRVLFSFTDTPVWRQVPRGSVPHLRIVGQTLNPSATRLDATIENSSLQDESRVTVIAVLFDSLGVARAASKSTIPLLAHSSTEKVVFTWSKGATDIVRAEISVLPSF